MPGLVGQVAASLRPRTWAAAQEAAQRSAAETDGGDWTPTVPDAVWMINLPGMWGEAVTSVGTWPYSWFPAGFANLTDWRMILWPFAAMPFWFSTGRGMDCLFDRLRCLRIGWFAFTLSSLAAAFGGLMLVLGLTDDNPSLRSPASNIAMAICGGLWLVLGAGTWLARFMQFRREREPEMTN